jgi:hypothetical protein
MTAELRALVQEELRRSPLGVLVRQLQDQVPQRGTGSPEGVVTAGPGGQYVNEADGVLWVHQVGGARSDTGWVAK